MNINRTVRRKNSTLEFARYYERPAFGFTLAEVLITLGIIGVVAAMTIPTLISNYQDKSNEVKYKKAKSNLSNGYKMMLVNEGVYDVDKLEFMLHDNDNEYTRLAHNKVFKFVSDSESGIEKAELPKNYRIEDKEDPSPFDWEDVPYIFQLSDGMLFGVNKNAETGELNVFLDTNGSLSPNLVNSDMYKFLITGNAYVADVTNDLTSTDSCSVENPDACTTEEGCNAMHCKVLPSDPTKKIWAHWYVNQYTGEGSCSYSIESIDATYYGSACP